MPPATLLLDDGQLLDDTSIVEMRIWRVPTPVPPSGHLFKYSLFYGRPGERIVLFDNPLCQSSCRLNISEPLGAPQRSRLAPACALAASTSAHCNAARLPATGWRREMPAGCRSPCSRPCVNRGRKGADHRGGQRTAFCRDTAGADRSDIGRRGRLHRQPIQFTSRVLEKAPPECGGGIVVWMLVRGDEAKCHRM